MLNYCSYGCTNGHGTPEMNEKHFYFFPNFDFQDFLVLLDVDSAGERSLQLYAYESVKLSLSTS